MHNKQSVLQVQGHTAFLLLFSVVLCGSLNAKLYTFSDDVACC